MSFNNETLFFHACVLKILLSLAALPVFHTLLWCSYRRFWGFLEVPKVLMWIGGHTCPCLCPAELLGEQVLSTAHRWDNRNDVVCPWAVGAGCSSPLGSRSSVCSSFSLLVLCPPGLLIPTWAAPHWGQPRAGGSEQLPEGSGHGRKVKRTEHCSAVIFSSFS